MSHFPVFRFAALAGFALAAPALAQEKAPPIPAISTEVLAEPEVALDELIRRALVNSPQLPIARETVEVARQRVGAARALGNPVLQIVPGIGNREARDEEVILSQPLDLFGKRRARAAVADAQLRAAQAQRTLTERSLVIAVKNATADLFAAQEAESLGDVQAEVARLFRDAAARRAQLGDVPPVQVQRAELELLRVQNDLTAAQTERLARRAALNLLVGQAPETPLRVALPFATNFLDALRLRPGAPQAALPLKSTVEFDRTLASPEIAQTPDVNSGSQVGSDLVALRAQLLAGAAERSDIVGAQATLDARRAQVKVLRSERRPDVEIQARRSSVFGSSSTAVRAVIVVPLFDFGSNRGERRALEAEARGQEAQIALLRSQTSAQIEQALIRLKQQRQTAERYRSGIVPLTLELLRKTQIGYAQGASTYLEVLEAQRTARQVQTEYLQALVGVRTSETTLEAAFGATLPAAFTANPASANPPPGVAAPGTVPEGVIPPNAIEPLLPPGTVATPQGGANR